MNRLFSSFTRRLVPSILLLAGAYAVTAQDDGSGSTAADTEAAAPVATASGDVERGKYLVAGIGMCGECHSARNLVGELQMDEWLQGAAVPVTRPNGYKEPWANKAPRIAGLPQHTDEEFVTLMTTGVNRDGKKLMAPMPQFRMTEEDALAIAAYLRTVP